MRLSLLHFKASLAYTEIGKSYENGNPLLMVDCLLET